MFLPGEPPRRGSYHFLTPAPGIATSSKRVVFLVIYFDVKVLVITNILMLLVRQAIFLNECF